MTPNFFVFILSTFRLALMGNLGWQDWSEFGKVGVAVTSEDTSSLTLDRNYKDTWHIAVGAQYRVADPWLLTAGVDYDSSMVDNMDSKQTLLHQHIFYCNRNLNCCSNLQAWWEADYYAEWIHRKNTAS